MIQYYYVLALKARTDYMFCAGFFHTRKNLKNFSKEVIKSHLDMELKGRIREALIKMILGFDIEDMDLEPEE